LIFQNFKPCNSTLSSTHTHGKPDFPTSNDELDVITYHTRVIGHTSERWMSDHQNIDLGVFARSSPGPKFLRLLTRAWFGLTRARFWTYARMIWTYKRIL